MTSPAALPPPLPRIASGIPGLDAVTGGGFLQSGVYILQGAPGAGKTILANHVVHRHASAGGKVVYVTLLAESHARLLQHMEGFAFFDPSALADRIYYVSAFNALRSGGLPGVVELLRKEMRSRQAGILVLDGLVMAASAAQSDEELKLFVSDIQFAHPVSVDEDDEICRFIDRTIAQMIAHHTSNGCNLKPGDLLGTGTISAPTEDGLGSLLEIGRSGAKPVELPSGETRAFLEDGDGIAFRGRLAADGHVPIGFGPCSGVIRPAVAGRS